MPPQTQFSVHSDVMLLTGGAARLIAHCVAKAVVGTSAIGTALLMLYSETKRGSGFGREARFWLDVGPVVFEYWWNCFGSSPKVRLMEALVLAFERSEVN